MLQSLSIRNFAIIDRLDVEFGPGLNVLTGETGAGKSILIGALNVILGGRAAADLVRSGADRAVIDAVFDVRGSADLLPLLEELGIEPEEGLLYLSREVGAAGKTTARIAGRPAPAGQLRQIGEYLVDLHGQHEHQSLLAVPRHLDMLDEWGGREVAEMRAQAAAAFRVLRDLERERASLETDARERARLLDLYRFQVQEINEAALQPGEEEELRAESRRLSNAQRLAESAESAREGLAAERSGILEQLAVIGRDLEAAGHLDEGLAPLAESVNNARYALEEAARDLVAYQDSIEHDPARLEQIEERLELIASLKRKYGDTVEDILTYGLEAAEKLDSLAHSEERGQELDEAIARASAEFSGICARLSDRRRELAREFSDAVMAELHDLAMEKTRFEAMVEHEEPGPRGADRVEFLIAPNPGEPLRPLARIASGGEVSRVMLAIKSAMARQEPLPTMVFDEIDVGVGGRTASVIGDKLSALAGNAQILCITHLPQIASRASAHYLIEKSTAGDRASTSVSLLDNEERVAELARMLAGQEVTETAIRHAREMLNVG